MAQCLEQINRFVWGIPALVMIVGVGIYLTVRTRFVQFSLFPQALRDFFSRFVGKSSVENGVSPYQALCTALAATVGTGNIAGVAGAIAIGGPGAVFWMWICAFLGMVTKYAEATLAVRYRGKNANGEYYGGPMLMIRQGMGRKFRFLGVVYSFFGVIACFGVGNATQVNAVITGVSSALSVFRIMPPKNLSLILGIGMSLLIGFMLLGGAKRIGKMAELLVPFASLFYIALSCGVLFGRAQFIPEAFKAILTGAFAPSAVTGGVIGSAFTALRIGASRGVFTNEAGMGTASIAHASAQVQHPAQQGLMGIMEVFLDTIVICTATALVILCSGIPIVYGADTGAELTVSAFSSVYGQWISVPIALCLCCFAFATILGWGLYGARCAQYLLGENAWRPFVYLQMITVVIGAVLNTKTVWLLAETVNGLMAIPNLICLAALCPELVRLTDEFRLMIRQTTAAGGTYENLNQCKPL